MLELVGIYSWKFMIEEWHEPWIGNRDALFGTKGVGNNKDGVWLREKEDKYWSMFNQDKRNMDLISINICLIIVHLCHLLPNISFLSIHQIVFEEYIWNVYFY